MSRADPPRRPYCLHCYAPLPAFQGASALCSGCGRSNLRVDLERLWTQERRFRELEDVLKVAVVLLMLAFSAYSVLVLGIQDHRALPMAIFVPGVLGVLLWDLAAITRRRATYRWDLLLALLGALVGGFWLLAVTARVVSARNPSSWTDWLGVAGVALVVLGVVLGGPLARWRWVRWREAFVARRQREVTGRPSESGSAPPAPR